MSQKPPDMVESFSLVEIKDLSFLNRTLGPAIQVLRRDRFTQHEMAELLTQLLGKSFDQSMFARIELGRRKIKAHELIVVCHILECSTASLIRLAYDIAQAKAVSG